MSGLMKTLHGASCKSLSAADAVAKCKTLGGGYAAILMDAAKCVFAGETPGLDRVYEARFFTGDWELRWLREGKDGRAAILSEKAIPAQDGWSPRDLGCLHCFDDPLLLWGKVFETPLDGWATLREGRIGTIEVPVAGATAGQRVAILQRSYFTCRPEDDGNLIFAASRYFGFQCVDIPKGKEKAA